MIVINPTTGMPVYRQIMDQVRLLTAGGAWKAGDRVPSIRELSTELGVNPLTVQKAYDLLAAEGILVKAPGRGVFVGEITTPKLSAAAREARVKPLFQAAATEARQLGVSPARQIKLLTDIHNEQRD